MSNWRSEIRLQQIFSDFPQHLTLIRWAGAFAACLWAGISPTGLSLASLPKTPRVSHAVLACHACLPAPRHTSAELERASMEVFRYLHTYQMYICWVVVGFLSRWGQRSRPDSTSSTLQRGPLWKGNEVRGLSCLSFLGGWAWTWGCRHITGMCIPWCGLSGPGAWRQEQHSAGPVAPEGPHLVLTDVSSPLCPRLF